MLVALVARAALATAARGRVVPWLIKTRAATVAAGRQVDVKRPTDGAPRERRRTATKSEVLPSGPPTALVDVLGRREKAAGLTRTTRATASVVVPTAVRTTAIAAVRRTLLGPLGRAVVLQTLTTALTGLRAASRRPPAQIPPIVGTPQPLRGVIMP